MDRLIVPGRPDPVQAQAAAIRQELAMGRLALRILAILLSRERGRRVAIRKDAWNKLAAKYPNAFVRFGEEAERITARLTTPAELAELERGAAAVAVEQEVAVAEEGGDGADGPSGGESSEKEMNGGE